MTKLWICGQLKGKWHKDGSKWEFQGVFDTRKKAVAACRNDSYCIWSAQLNEELPDEMVLGADACYPTIEERGVIA